MVKIIIEHQDLGEIQALIRWKLSLSNSVQGVDDSILRMFDAGLELFFSHHGNGCELMLWTEEERRQEAK